jgi:hypothetical protein
MVAGLALFHLYLLSTGQTTREVYMYNMLGVWGYIYTRSHRLCATRDCLQNQVLRRQSCPYLSPVPRGVFPFKRATAGVFAPAVLSRAILPP